MKRIILLTLLIPVLAHAQRYGHTSAGAAGAGSTEDVRANVGLTAEGGTTATDTVVTYFLWDGKYQRAMFVDTDNDSIIIAPHSLFPLAGKDATSLFFAFDSTGRLGLNPLTSAQATRAFLNVLGRASSDTVAIFSNDGGGIVGDSTVIIRASGNIQSGARAGFGVATSGQAARAFLNVIGFGDTLAAFIGDVNKAIGDSSVYVTSTGRISVKGATFASTSVNLTVTGYIQSSIGFIAPLNSGLENFSTGSSVTFRESSNSITLRPTGASGAAIVSKTTGTTSQAFVTIRPSNVATLDDTLLIVRNDVNSTLDSTAMVFADGSGYFGGNNLYLGGHRIRSNAAGDSLIFYDGSTMIFAILSDGSTADLVAGTPPGFRGIPPMEYRILLWVIAILLLILVAWKVFELVAKIKLNRYDTRIERA